MRDYKTSSCFAKNSVEVVGVVAIIVVDGVVIERVQEHIETPSSQLAKPVI
jgi:hypothetical protein